MAEKERLSTDFRMDSTDRDELEGGERPFPWSGLTSLAVLVFVALLLGMCRPVRELLKMDTLERLVRDFGPRGPSLIAGLVVLSTVLFLPRWPICFICGMLYGVTLGTILSTLISLAPAWVHYRLASGLLSGLTRRVLAKSRFAHVTIPQERGFAVVFLLRAFPLSNFVVTNLLGGALKLRPLNYLLASFLGMIPSSIMYAAWGKFAKKPSPQFLAVAVVIMAAVAGGYVLLHQQVSTRLSQMLRSASKQSDGSAETPTAMN